MNRLKIARIAADMNQKEAANLLGVSQVTLSRYENGERQLRVPVAKKLAEIYRVPWTYFYEEDDDVAKALIS